MKKKKKKTPFMKKTIKFIAEGQRLRVQGASFIAKRGHNFFFTKPIIKFLRVEWGHMPPFNPPSLRH
jgi:hypothetical protein